MESLPSADAANVFAWVSTVFCLVSCLVMTYITATSFNHLRLSLLFIAFVQLAVTTANLLRSYDRVSRHDYFDFTRICDLIFADVLVMLMLSIAGGFYPVLKPFRVWYWGCIVGAAAGTMCAVLGTALASLGVEKELSETSYGIVLATVAATFFYTLWPLLRTKRERYGDSKAFAAGIWYFSNLSIILLVYIGLFVWEIISVNNDDMNIIASSFAFIVRTLLLVTYAFPPPKSALSFIQHTIMSVYHKTNIVTPSISLQPLTDTPSRMENGVTMETSMTRLVPVVVRG